MQSNTKEETAMNIKEIVEEAKNKAPNLMVHELIQEFEEFAGALNHLQTYKGDDQEKLQIFMRKMSDSHDRLRTYFMRVAASYGMTFDQFCEFINNANNFAPTDWEEIQATKKELVESLNLPKPKGKGKKLNKNMKI
jgi:hypothetical protein